MLDQVKEVIYSVRDSTSSIAKSLGITTADIAKSAGMGGVGLVKILGARRVLLGAGLLSVAVGGGVIVVRYLRRREQAELDEESMEASDAAMDDRRGGKLDRPVHRANATAR